MANNKNKEKIGFTRRNLFNGSCSDHNRAAWSGNDTKFFLDLLVGEKNGGNWAGKCPTLKGYDNIINTFQQQLQITRTRKQFKSKYEALRSLFHLWTNMFNGQTGAGYDIATGAMIMEDAWWDNKIKEKEAYQKFRNGGLENAELMYQVYGDNSATGAYQYTPTSLNPVFRNSQVDETEENDSSPPRNQQNNEDYEVNSPNQARVESGRSRLSGGKRKSSSSQDNWNESLMNQLRLEFGSSANQATEYTIKHVTVNLETEMTQKALDILYEMEDLDPMLFDVGLNVIMDDRKKAIFINLRTNADRLRFLQRNAGLGPS